MVRYDVFAGAVPRPVVWRPRIVGRTEEMEQLRLPEPVDASEWTYEPFEESA